MLVLGACIKAVSQEVGSHASEAQRIQVRKYYLHSQPNTTSHVYRRYLLAWIVWEVFSHMFFQSSGNLWDQTVWESRHQNLKNGSFSFPRQKRWTPWSLSKSLLSQPRCSPRRAPRPPLPAAAFTARWARRRAAETKGAGHRPRGRSS